VLINKNLLDPTNITSGTDRFQLTNIYSAISIEPTELWKLGNLGNPGKHGTSGTLNNRETITYKITYSILSDHIRTYTTI
jgi:hypothetical protein